MPVIEGTDAGALLGVKLQTAVPAHVTAKPVPGDSNTVAYRVAARVPINAALAADSRIFSLYDPSFGLRLVVTRVQLRWVQTAAVTSAVFPSLAVNLSTITAGASDGGTAVTPRSVRPRAGAVPYRAASASVRHGNGAALTGFTAGTTMPLMYLPIHQLQTLSTVEVNSATLDWQPSVSAGEHPVVVNRLEALAVAVGPTVAMGSTGASVV